MGDFDLVGELAKHAWTVIVFIAVAIGAVVGFLFQLRMLRKLRLDAAKLDEELKSAEKARRKLELDIDALLRKAQQDEREAIGIKRGLG